MPIKPNHGQGPTVALPAVGPDCRRDLIAAAVRRFEDAVTLLERLEEPVDVGEDPEDDGPERCCWAAYKLHDDAEAALIWSILTADPGLHGRDFARPGVEKLPRPARGVVVGGRLYVAAPRSGRGDELPGRDATEHTLGRMRLVAVDLANVEVLP